MKQQIDIVLCPFPAPSVSELSTLKLRVKHEVRGMNYLSSPHTVNLVVAEQLLLSLRLPYQRNLRLARMPDALRVP